MSELFFEGTPILDIDYSYNTYTEHNMHAQHVAALALM